ncbi:DNA-3-methyladenine glycosylase I [Streptomyces poriticola]|uniref:DNA-3-methyladenine glycosylase I n=1 Tax=Streptomyces poriticola TaxID=3120506 RepID=UPI0038CDBA08
MLRSGPSRRTILAEREKFRSALAAFEVSAVARSDQRDVGHLLGDVGVVRHRGKIEAMIDNARRAAEPVEREDRSTATPADARSGPGHGGPAENTTAPDEPPPGPAGPGVRRLRSACRAPG